MSSAEWTTVRRNNRHPSAPKPKPAPAASTAAAPAAAPAPAPVQQAAVVRTPSEPLSQQASVFAALQARDEAAQRKAERRAESIAAQQAQQQQAQQAQQAQPQAEAHTDEAARRRKRSHGSKGRAKTETPTGPVLVPVDGKARKSKTVPLGDAFALIDVTDLKSAMLSAAKQYRSEFVQLQVLAEYLERALACVEIASASNLLDHQLDLELQRRNEAVWGALGALLCSLDVAVVNDFVDWGAATLTKRTGSTHMFGLRTLLSVLLMSPAAAAWSAARVQSALAKALHNAPLTSVYFNLIESLRYRNATHLLHVYINGLVPLILEQASAPATTLRMFEALAPLLCASLREDGSLSLPAPVLDALLRAIDVHSRGTGSARHVGVVAQALRQLLSVVDVVLRRSVLQASDPSVYFDVLLSHSAGQTQAFSEKVLAALGRVVALRPADSLKAWAASFAKHLAQSSNLMLHLKAHWSELRREIPTAALGAFLKLRATELATLDAAAAGVDGAVVRTAQATCQDLLWQLSPPFSRLFAVLIVLVLLLVGAFVSCAYDLVPYCPGFLRP